MGREKEASIQQTVQRNVKAFRLEAGLSQQELATRSGLHVRYISRLEISPQNVTLDILAKIAASFGKAPTELLEGAHITVRKRDVRLLEEAIKSLQVFKSLVAVKGE